MTHEIANQTITRASVQKPRYLADFGRIEADIVLHLGEDNASAKSVNIVTSVPAKDGESFQSLYLRLTQDVARLWRLLETHGNFANMKSESPLAA